MWIRCLILTVTLLWQIPLPAQQDTLIDAQDTSLLTVSGRDILYELMQSLPDGGEAALALIDGEETVYYGVRREDGRLVTVENADRHFGIGSITKVLTATLLADMAAKGEVSPDQPVNAAYPFPFADSITFTYRQLASHSSGLPRMPNNMPGLIVNPDDPYIDYTPENLESYLREGLTVAPDGNGGYSNLGFGLLGYTLGERIDTVGYATALRRRVLDPLGMMNTHFGGDDLATLVPGLNAGGSPDKFWSFTEALGAAGALVSTARDMAIFLRAQLDRAQHVLALTREEQVINNERRSVGLGWQIQRLETGRTLHWHNGGVGGYRSFTAVDVAGERGVVLLTNVLPLGNQVDNAGFRYME